MPDRDDYDEAPRLRPFWAGTVTFGLVSVPVDLYTGTRSSHVGMRMLSPKGVPLSRRYFCPEDDEDVTTDEIVRGYEVEDGRFVTVTDDELEELEPRKSRDIDVREFVPLDDLDPVYFERAYFLAPGGGSAKAYRLLADSLEREQRAGIATFVMRGREYLIAIIGENGILRAETLRFQDEIRTADDIGLPRPAKPPRALVRAFVKAIDAKLEDDIDEDELRDEYAERIEALVDEKEDAGRDIVHAPAGLAEEEADTDVIDIMEALKRRIRSAGGESDGKERGAKKHGRKTGSKRSGARRDGDAGGDGLEDRGKADLYRRAQKLDIPGRSDMSKPELIRAIRRSA